MTSDAQNPCEAPLIRLDNVNVTRNHTTILDHISLTIHKRDFLTIIGPNGAGKSMLLKCLMGFYKPDSGKIIRLNQLKIGYVPQKFIPQTTLPLLTQDFISLCSKHKKSDLTKIIKQTEITDLLQKQLSELSGGQLQRVLLARALINNPDLLILDEPVQNLDIAGQLAFYKLLDHIYSDRNIAIVMVSHDLHMVMTSSTRVLCLFKHICCSGTPQEISKDPSFVSLFGNSRIGFYHHHHDHNHHNNVNHSDCCEPIDNEDCHHGHS